METNELDTLDLIPVECIACGDMGEVLEVPNYFVCVRCMAEIEKHSPPLDEKRKEAKGADND